MPRGPTRPGRRRLPPLLRGAGRAALRPPPGPPQLLRAPRPAARALSGAQPAAGPGAPPRPRPFLPPRRHRLGLLAAARRRAPDVWHHVAAPPPRARQLHRAHARVAHLALAGACHPAPDLLPPVLAAAPALLDRPRAPLTPHRAHALRRRRLQAVQAQHSGRHPRRVRQPHVVQVQQRVHRRRLLRRRVRAQPRGVHAPHAQSKLLPAAARGLAIPPLHVRRHSRRLRPGLLRARRRQGALRLAPAPREVRPVLRHHTKGLGGDGGRQDHRRAGGGARGRGRQNAGAPAGDSAQGGVPAARERGGPERVHQGRRRPRRGGRPEEDTEAGERAGGRPPGRHLRAGGRRRRALAT
ncbi:uncharacterized protein LOC100381635 [Zea mays]|uniref:Uncharacterized protein n=1 Tax=Zea mays TaxID=4577 RepID=C0HHP3_MAIZE|nr:uncharacterized protein LOC100381635 [Zea mays]ACN26546.1 unknown [Zea mays]|eukprot:NP_001167922.1 uncharacterized protein LOC100381635 [Zea mays]